MAIRTISSTIAGPVSFAPNYSNAITITSLGGVLSSGGGAYRNGEGVVGTGTLVNDGYIAATYVGVQLSAGLVSNASYGFITAGRKGVSLAAAATLINDGYVGGTDYGVLSLGGAVTNAGGALITSSQGDGIAGKGTIVNAGTIAGSSDASYAVSLASGAPNRVVVYPYAVFSGIVDGGNVVSGAVASVLEFAYGTAASSPLSGGWNRVTNKSDGGSPPVISETPLAAADDGALGGPAEGTFTGLGSKYIGFKQIDIGAGAAWVAEGTNTLSAGYRLNDAGSLTVVGSLVSDGVVSIGAAGISLQDGLLVNQGVVTGNAAALVTGYGTVINLGTIAASAGGYAVSLASGGYGNEVVVYPGAVFAGLVYGGNAIGGPATNVLEFGPIVNAATSGGWNRISNTSDGYTGISEASLYAPADTPVDGTFSGLGSTYLNFEQIGIGAGAAWVAEGTNTLNAGYRLNDAGSLTVAGSLVNDGQVRVGSQGITLAGGLIVNNGVMLAAGAYAYVTGNGTLVNAGTIAADSGAYAVSLASGAGDRVVVYAGAVFGGIVAGGNTLGGTATSTLAFAGDGGTLSGLGSSYVQFATIAVDAGAAWTATGGNTLAAGYVLADSGTLTLAETLAGSGEISLGAGGVLVLANPTAVAATIDGLKQGTIEFYQDFESVSGYGGRQLTLSAGLVFNLSGGYSPSSFEVAHENGNTYITACFASGTRILGEAGPVAVEALRVGDFVWTARGRLAPVRWIGFRRTDLARHPRPHDVMPVRVRAGAFGEAMPLRDLVLSPDHAVFVEGRLVPIRYLINGVSIVQERCRAVTYWHVELDRHDVVLAEGLACESFLDTGNHGAFENGGDVVAMTPDFARAVWATDGCAPIVTDPADPWLRVRHLLLLARARRLERMAANA